MDTSQDINKTIAKAKACLMNIKFEEGKKELEGKLETKILALDLATNTGFAGTEGDTIMVSGTVNFAIKRGESPGMLFVRFRAWLKEMLDTLKPDIVGYELPHHRGGAATRVLVGMCTHLEGVCASKGIEYTGVQSGVLKKHATGKGGAAKEVMIAKAEETWPNISFINDDHADATWVADYVYSVFVSPDKGRLKAI